MVSLAIDYEMVLCLAKGMEYALRDGMNLTGPDAQSRCQMMIQEPSTVSSRRTDLQKKLGRLHAASVELRKLLV